VIAVIAILIAVLVPTFTALINKANESKDSQLASNLNTTLTSYAAINGEPETPHEMLTALEEDGYLLKNMTPTSEGYSYIWDEKTNSIALISDKFEFVYNKSSVSLSTDEQATTLWAIVSTQSQIDEIKASGYKFKYCVVATTAVEVDNSFDSYYAGDANVTLTNTTAYADADDVTFTMYTDGGEFTINTPYASVAHYGDASLVNVTAVKTSSYHVYGEVKMAVLTKGRLVVEEDASVSILAITTTSTSDYSVAVSTATVSESIGTIYTTTDTTLTVTTSDSTETATTITSSSITDEDGNVTISNITYATTTKQLEAFISGGAGMCVLKNNITIDSAISLTSGQFMMIDLNGYTLTSTHTSPSTSRNSISDKSELTISNGTLKYEQIEDRERGVFVVNTGSKLTLNNVDVSTNGAFIFPKGDAAEVNVIGSTITTSGSYCIATSAGSTDNYNVAIYIQNSTLETTESSAYDCPVTINVPGTLTIDGCYIYGQRQGVAVRAGTATITDTTISCSIDASNITDTLKGYTNYTTKWSSCPNMALGAVVVGSAGNKGYNANAILTMKNCILSYDITGTTNSTAVTTTEEAQYEIALYLVANSSYTDSDSNTTTYFNTTVELEDCTINGKVIKLDMSKVSSEVETYNNNSTVNLSGYSGTVYTTWSDSSWS
ncbi:MAG: hypothetical protein LUD27_03390, partial [Clostridia bacterium]|nr:hypothetical protein [Clostridia bacterium]